MKRVPYGMAVTVGLMLVLSTVIPAQSGMMGQRPMGQSEGAAESSPGGMMGTEGQGSMGMMGPQMMRGMTGGGMPGMPEGMGMSRPSQLVRMLKAELGLSDEQVKQLTQIFSQMMKARITPAERRWDSFFPANEIQLVRCYRSFRAVGPY
jgi:hypothetical protein